jgi:GDP-L-fucose synthase
MLDLKDAKVMVTGGTSMVGKAIVKNLLELGAEVNVMTHDSCDLLNMDETFDYVRLHKPEYIIHAAGWNGGIGWNKRFPATIYYRTATMALNIYNAISLVGSVKKSVGILASCSYPDLPVEAFQEKDLWSGKPNSTVECHGLAKRVIADFGRQVSKQYLNVQCVSCILNNCYGPYDSFHPDKTKVVGALIRRFVEAKYDNAPEVVCWGTGAPLREFVYAPDAGKAIVKCLQRYDDVNYPINIGSGEEISIRELTELIAEIVQYRGRISWDTDKPDGQLRKRLDRFMFNYLFPNMQFTDIKTGLKQTIDWYIANKDLADSKGF